MCMDIMLFFVIVIYFDGLQLPQKEKDGAVPSRNDLRAAVFLGPFLGSVPGPQSSFFETFFGFVSGPPKQFFWDVFWVLLTCVSLSCPSLVFLLCGLAHPESVLAVVA